MRASITVIASCLSIAACGGGGGGSTSMPTPPTAMVKITSGNATEIMRTAYSAALASASLGDLSGETGLIAGGPDQVSKLDGSFGTASKANGDGSSQATLPPTTEFCSVSGSVTISGDIADPFTPTLTPNDYFNIEFDQCIDNPGETTHGILRFVVDDFAGDFLAGAYDLTMTLTLDNFQVTTAADALTSNGSATVTLNTLNTPSVAASVSGSSMTVDSNAGAETLRNFISAQTLDAGIFPSPYTMTASGTLDTTELNGTVRYSTPVMFEGFDNDYPGVGEFLVTGDNSSARLVAESNVNVRVEIDLDNDTVIDETINTTWAEIDSLP